MCCLACIVPIMMNLINIKSNANDESRCRVEKGGGEYRHTNYETFYKYVRYNTANNVSNCGGDPVTQLIVNVYQIIKI